MIAFALTLVIVVRPVLSNMFKKNESNASAVMPGDSLHRSNFTYESQLAQVKQMASENSSMMASNLKDMIKS